MTNMKNLREKLLKYGVWILVFILPLVYFTKMLYPYTSPKTFFFYGFVEILTVLWIYTIMVDNSYRLTKKTLLYFIPLVAFILWITISGIISVNPELSFWSSLGRGTGLITWYHCLALALIVASLVKHYGKDYLDKLMFWFVNGSFILAISVWFGSQGFNVFGFMKNDGGGGLVGNSSLAAPYLMFALAFGLFFIFSKSVSNNKKWWIGSVLAVIILCPLFADIHGLFVNHDLLGSARGATLGIIVGVCVSILTYLFFSKKKILKIVGIVGISIGLIAFVIGWVQLVKPNTYLHQAFDNAATGGSRFIFWDIAQKTMNEHPMLGLGPETYMIAFQRHFNPQMALAQYGQEGWNDRAHNVYYDTGISGGYPAIILYGLFFLSLLYALYKINKIEAFNRVQVAILGGLIIGYVFQNLFVFDSLNSLMALFVLSGIVFAFVDNKKGEKHSVILSDHLNLYIIEILLSILCIVALIFFAFRPAQKAATFYKVFNMPANIRPAHYNDLLKGSTIGDQWDVSEIAYFIYKSYVQDPASIKNNKTLLPYVVNDLNAYLQYLEEVMKRNTKDSRLYISTEYLYSALNYFSDRPFDKNLAEHMFAIAEYSKKLSPTDPQVYWSVAQIYMWEGDDNNTIKSYQQAITLDPNIPESYKLLLNFSKGIGNQKVYQETLLEAQKNIPSLFK